MKDGHCAKVLWIGRTDVEAFERLGEELRANGLDLEVPHGRRGLLSALRDLARLVVVFRGTSAEAEEVFDALRSQYRPIPIVVLTATPSCGDYYRLSGIGPTYFCTEVEASEPIRQVIRRAAALAA